MEYGHLARFKSAGDIMRGRAAHIWLRLNVCRVARFVAPQRKRVGAVPGYDLRPSSPFGSSSNGAAAEEAPARPAGTHMLCARLAGADGCRAVGVSAGQSAGRRREGGKEANRVERAVSHDPQHQKGTTRTRVWHPARTSHSRRGVTSKRRKDTPRTPARPSKSSQHPRLPCSESRPRDCMARSAATRFCASTELPPSA